MLFEKSNSVIFRKKGEELIEQLSIMIAYVLAPKMCRYRSNGY